MPESYIGLKVRKKFNNSKFYNGTVSKYDKRKKWFLINYNDGDAEEINLIKFKKILINTKDTSLKKPTTEIRKRVV